MLLWYCFTKKQVINKICFLSFESWQEINYSNIVQGISAIAYRLINQRVFAFLDKDWTKDKNSEKKPKDSANTVWKEKGGVTSRIEIFSWL